MPETVTVSEAMPVSEAVPEAMPVTEIVVCFGIRRPLGNAEQAFTESGLSESGLTATEAIKVVGPGLDHCTSIFASINSLNKYTNIVLRLTVQKVPSLKLGNPWENISDT
jgi:hypothetical protein